MYVLTLNQFAIPTGRRAGEAGARIASGMRLAFQEANDAGGMLGRTLTLVALEDGYSRGVTHGHHALCAAQFTNPGGLEFVVGV